MYLSTLQICDQSEGALYHSVNPVSIHHVWCFSEILHIIHNENAIPMS